MTGFARRGNEQGKVDISISTQTPVARESGLAEPRVDERFWREAFRAHGPFLLRVVERLSGPGGHVEEIVQETFALAFKKGGPDGGLLPEGGALRGWLYRVAANKVLHHRRSIARFLGFSERFQREPARTAPRPDDVADARADKALVRTCVTTLPFKLRETFVLYELEGMSSVEIAGALDLSENTVRSRLRLARDRFRKELARRAPREGSPS